MNKKIRWIIKQLNRNTPIREIAVMRVMERGISTKTKTYRETSKIPQLKRAGRKAKPTDKKLRK